MASKDMLEVRALLSRGTVGQVGTDSPVAIRLAAKAAAGAVTSVTVTTATNLVLISANGGTETFAFATYTTVGALADKINASNYWECKILDSLRSKATASNFVDGAITAQAQAGVTFYDVLVDTSAALYFAYRLTMNRLVGVDFPQGSHRVLLQEINYLANVGTAAFDNLQVWQCTQSGGSEVQLLKLLNVDNTNTTVNWASGEAVIAAPDGADIVVLLKDAASFPDSASNFLTVVGTLE